MGNKFQSLSSLSLVRSDHHKFVTFKFEEAHKMVSVGQRQEETTFSTWHTNFPKVTFSTWQAIMCESCKTLSLVCLFLLIWTCRHISVNKGSLLPIVLDAKHNQVASFYRPHPIVSTSKDKMIFCSLQHGFWCLHLSAFDPYDGWNALISTMCLYTTRWFES